MIPTVINKQIEQKLSDRFGSNVIIIKTSLITGGCINNAAKLKTNRGIFFVKWNTNTQPKMFEAENSGLNLLKNTQTMSIPLVFAFDNNFLVLEYIPNYIPNTIFWKNFGVNLAKMHRYSNSKFGLSINNYIGSLTQQNTQHTNWSTFFIEERLKKQLSLRNFSIKILLDFDKLFKKIPSLFPKEKPSLIHGDLWEGNFLVKDNDIPVLIDPAVYYGHREMDIAMSKLFGGFNNNFYDSYNEYYPLENGWQERIKICNLYPLLVHVNLFGGGYINQVKNILDRFVG